MAKNPEEKLTGAVLHVCMRRADKARIKEAAQSAGTAEMSAWARAALLKAADLQLSGRWTPRELDAFSGAAFEAAGRTE